MNIEEANANIGKEVVYIGKNKEVISVFNGKKLLISYPTKIWKQMLLLNMMIFVFGIYHYKI